MKKYYFILLIITVSILLSACGPFNDKYQKINSEGGATVFLDSKSINYNKDDEKITCWVKVTYDDTAKSKASKNWASQGKNGVNPFLETQYALYLIKMTTSSKDINLVEINYMDKNDKAISREHFNDSDNEMTFGDIADNKITLPQ